MRLCSNHASVDAGLDWVRQTKPFPYEIRTSTLAPSLERALPRSVN